jgi:tetratricopeptide (TPR) repeat protein
MLSAALLAGDWAEAERLAELASSRVNIFLAGEKGERDALSLLGREKAKPFKGEPHERAMADFYLGILRLRRGDHEGAFNAFLSAMYKVRGTYRLPLEQEKAREGQENEETFLFENEYSTFAFLAAYCLQRIDEPEEAARYLQKAKKAQPSLAFLFDQGMDTRTNVIAIIEAGHAPWKVRQGNQGEILEYQRGPTSDFLEIRLGDTPLSFGRTDDLLVQATTFGGRSMDELNRTKAVRQEILQNLGLAATMAGAMIAMAGNDSRNRNLEAAGLITLGVGLAAMIFAATAIDPSADIRSWSTLPDQIYISVGQAEPGDHEVKIKARGQYGDDQSQSWTGVPIREGTNLLWFRLVPGNRGGVYPFMKPSGISSQS